MRIVQKAVIKKGDKFLILLRAPESRFPDHWDFAGGGLEPGEDPIKGVEREILEETTLKAKILKIVGIYDFDFDNKGETTHRFRVYSTELISGDIKLSDEHVEFRWATNHLFYDIRKDGLEEEKELIATLEHIIELIDKNID